MAIEAVIFDFGGVLTSSPFEAFTRFETERGLPVDIIRRTNAANHLENAWAKFERAEVDIETFDHLFAAESLALGAEVRGRDVLPLLQGDLRPEMVEALKRIKAGLKTGCITNNLPANAIGLWRAAADNGVSGRREQQRGGDESCKLLHGNTLRHRRDCFALALADSAC